MAISAFTALSLSPSSAVYTTLIALLFCYGSYCIYQLHLHPLAKLPGPTIAAFTNAWKAYHVYRLHLHDVLTDLHARYGPVIRIGPNDVHIQNPEAVMDIYKGGRAFRKTEFYDAFQTFNANLFGTQNEDVHAIRRRQLAHGFSQKSIIEMEAVLDEQLAIFCRRLDGFAKTAEVFDLKDCLSRYVLDVLGEIAFAFAFNAQTPGAGTYESIPNAINGHILLGCVIGELPWQALSKQLLAWSPVQWMRELIQNRLLLKQTCASCVHARLNGSSQRKDLLRSLIVAKDPETGAGLSEIDINTEAYAMLVAGSHTTAGTLSLFFANVLRQRDIMDELESELDQDLGAPRGRETHLIEDIGDSFPILQACVRENFRTHPVFTMPLWRYVEREEGLTVGDIIIPQHTKVAASSYVQHHNPAIWEDHDLYRPKRWLEADAKDLERVLIPFSIGHRMCIGRNLAMTNIFKTITTVLTRFEVRLDPSQVKKPVVLQSSGIGELKGTLLCTVRRKEKAD